MLIRLNELPQSHIETKNQQQITQQSKLFSYTCSRKMSLSIKREHQMRQSATKASKRAALSNALAPALATASHLCAIECAADDSSFAQN